MAAKKTIAIIGASRGLGLALAQEYCARNWNIIATARGKSAGLDALRERYPAALEIENVDIVDIASVKALRERLAGRKLDTLFVNAGISTIIDACHSSRSPEHTDAARPASARCTWSAR
jgi:NAD(P)-dependent dehydrogenase (short-subunit alcohol dehydrogenase family)